MQGGLLLVWTRFRAGAASRYELIVTGDLVVKAVEALLDALEFFKRYLALLAEDLPARFIRGIAFHERLTMLKLGPIIGLRTNSKASVGKEKHRLLLVHITMGQEWLKSKTGPCGRACSKAYALFARTEFRYARERAMSGKTLVAYFSASGVTEAVARRLADAIGADVFEIAPREAYTAADLDWTDSSSRSTRECKDPACRPALKSMPEGMEAYETVLIGFPIWWYTAPNIIKTFLEAGDFSSARIALFATSGGSGMGKTMSDLEPSASQARWLDARRFSSDASARDLAAWVDTLA